MFKRLFGVVAVTAMVSGCTAYPLGGNAQGGVINHVYGNNTDQAIAAADQECSKYGKKARVTQISAWLSNMTYDCVS